MCDRLERERREKQTQSASERRIAARKAREIDAAAALRAAGRVTGG